MVQEMVRDLMRKDGLLERFLREKQLEKAVCHRDKINVCQGGANPECGGQCRAAREALEWPDDLPLVAFPGTSIKSAPARAILDFIRSSPVLQPYMTESFRSHLDNIPEEARKGRKPRMARSGLGMVGGSHVDYDLGGHHPSKRARSEDDAGPSGPHPGIFPPGMLPPFPLPPPPMIGANGAPGPLPNLPGLPPLNLPNLPPMPPGPFSADVGWTQRHSPAIQARSPLRA